MKISKLLLRGILLCIVLLAPQSASAADIYPSKSIKVIVPFPPGGGADTLIRIIAPMIGEIWKQSLVIENRPGASGFIGAVVTCLPLTFLNLVPLLPKPEKFRSYGLRDK